MITIPIQNANIDQLLRPYLFDRKNNGKIENEPSINSNTAATTVLDNVLVDYGCKYRIIVEINQREQEQKDYHAGHGTISIHIAVHGWQIIEKYCIQNLHSIFGPSRVFVATYTIEEEDHLHSAAAIGSTIHKENKTPDFQHPKDSSSKVLVAKGYNLCIQVCTNDLPINHDAQSTRVLLSNIRQVILGCELKDAFTALWNDSSIDTNRNTGGVSSTSRQTFKIPLANKRFKHDDTAAVAVAPQHQFITISCQIDRVIAIIPFLFGDEIDCALAKLFLQQFQQAQRKSMNERHGNNVPICDYRRSVDPPSEIKYEKLDSTNNDTKSTTINAIGYHHAGYLILTFLENHVDSKEKRFKAISNILILVDFVDYHVKCSKSNMHSRMRSKKDALVKYLNHE